MQIYLHSLLLGKFGLGPCIPRLLCHQKALLRVPLSGNNIKKGAMAVPRNALLT
jgi:hypothetical protein